MAQEIDLDDTSNCPIAETCAGCGSDHDLCVVTVETAVGVYCVTLCRADRVRPLSGTSAVAAVKRCLAHCGHLGITADQMETALTSESVDQ